MRVCSLKHRDDERNDPGHIVAEFSGEEIIALNKMMYHATKELHGKSDALELYKSIYLLLLYSMGIWTLTTSWFWTR